MNDLYLKHHGILGMKWGVRRFQSYDAGYQADHIGRFVGEMKKRKAVDRSGYKKADVAKARDEYYDKTSSFNSTRAERRKALSDYTFEQAKAKSQKQKKITERQARYEEEYRKKGATKEEAAAYAFQKVNAEKMIAATAAVAVAALASYGAYKMIKAKGNNFGGTIRMGTELSRISGSGTKGVHDAFYASLAKNKGDVQTYRGFYGDTIRSRGSDVYEKSIKVVGDIKVASRRDAAAVLKELSKDRSFLDPMKEAAAYVHEGNRLPGYTDAQHKMFEKAHVSLSKGKIDKNVVDAFNNIIASDVGDTKKRYLSALKAKGYGALLDTNDRMYSDYRTKRPLIIFDTGKVAVEQVRKLSNEEIDREFANAASRLSIENTGRKFIDSIPKNVMGMTLLTGGLAGSKLSSSKKDAQFVEQYKKEHPNTDKSYREIARMRHTDSK